eukprot:scaffold119174_cov63-Phaeocystis_antarctica.AAC.1
MQRLVAHAARCEGEEAPEHGAHGRAVGQRAHVQHLVRVRVRVRARVRPGRPRTSTCGGEGGAGGGEAGGGAAVVVVAAVAAAAVG